MSLSKLTVQVICDRLSGVANYDLGERAVAAALKEFQSHASECIMRDEPPPSQTDEAIQSAYVLLDEMRKEAAIMQKELASARRALRAMRKILKEKEAA